LTDRTRVDKFGVTNPNIQRIPGTGRIQVELPGVDNPERARKLLSAAARLEFCEVVELGEYANAMTQVGEYLLANEKNAQALGATLKADTKGTDSTKAGLEAQLAGKTTAKNDTTKKDTTAANTAGGALGKYFIQLQSGLGSTVKDTGRVNALLARPEVKALFPPNFYFLWDVKPVTKTSNTNEDVLGLTVVRRDPQGNAPLEGDVITDAAQDFDQSGRVEVTMAMNAEGARKWRNLTAANVGKRVAIVLDEYVYSAPVVQNEIPNGRSSISGTFTVEEGQDLANVLKAGKLPAKITIAEEAVVGATLGSESVSKGLMSSLVGLVVVLLFMIAYYNRAGIIADIALVVNLFLLMGIMAYLKAVLTLPGIAGIVLTIGYGRRCQRTDL
jgi:SecD/SecF fusion protein